MKIRTKTDVEKNMFYRLVFSWFGPHFGGVFWRYFDRKTAPIQKARKIEKPYKTLAMPAKMEGQQVNNLSKINWKSLKNTKKLQPQFEIEFVMILLHIWRPNSTPNHSKSLDFPHQNLEAQKCKIPEAFTAREGWPSRHFWSLGGRGETTKHRTHAGDLTTPMGQCPGEFLDEGWG